MVQIINKPETETFKVNHITEEEMNEQYGYENIYSWIADPQGVIEVTVYRNKRRCFMRYQR